MSQVVFTMKLDQELRDEFMSAASAADRTASQLMRDLMRSYLHQQKKNLEYEEYHRLKVEAGRQSMRAGRGKSNEVVEALFADKRRQTLATHQ